MFVSIIVILSIPVGKSPPENDVTVVELETKLLVLPTTGDDDHITEYEPYMILNPSPSPDSEERSFGFSAHTGDALKSLDHSFELMLTNVYATAFLEGCTIDIGVVKRRVELLVRRKRSLERTSESSLKAHVAISHAALCVTQLLEWLHGEDDLIDCGRSSDARIAACLKVSVIADDIADAQIFLYRVEE